jgi:hypothetical protein
MPCPACNQPAEGEEPRMPKAPYLGGCNTGELAQ